MRKPVKSALLERRVQKPLVVPGSGGGTGGSPPAGPDPGEMNFTDEAQSHLVVVIDDF
jgi:hypothetical protein